MAPTSHAVPLAQRMTPTNPYARKDPETWQKVLARKGRAPSNWVLEEPKTVLQHFAKQGLAAPEVYLEKDFDRGPVPRHPVWRDHAFLLTAGLFPLYVQAVSYWALPDYKWNPWAAYAFYFVAFFVWITLHINRLHRMMDEYGTFGERTRGRDIPSDRKIHKLLVTTLTGFVLRTSATFIMAYDQNKPPIFTLWSPLKIIAWTVCLDAAFYTYHRSAHEVPWLWNIHQQHHGTKRPSPIHTIIADDRQECLEIVLIPLFASACVPLTFAEGWASIVYLMYTESMGHSGIRAHMPTPISALFQPLGLGLELCVEDHDLHHAYGRGGRNYGKQTRIFDRLFGTITPREETTG